MRNNILILPFVFILPLYLTSCIHQDPSYLQLQASDLVDSVQKISPKDKRTLRAAESFHQGELQLLRSNFNLSRYFFKEAIRDAEDVLEDAQISDAKAAEIAAKKPARIKDPNAENAAAEAAKAKPSPSPKLTQEFETNFQGRVIFLVNEASPSTREDLTRALKILVGDPKKVLSISPQLGQDEGDTLVTQRYDQVRAWLVKSGVLETQLRLESTKRSEFPFFDLKIIQTP